MQSAIFASMTYQALLKEIKQRKFRPVYLLHGAEPFFIDELAAAITERALEEHERAFNETILYGKETDHLTVLDAARRVPMMAERQLVVVREAQEMRSLPKLQGYVEKPVPSTVLVLCHKYKKVAGNTKFGKAAKANAAVFESKPLYDNQVPDWVEQLLREWKLRIEPSAAELLGEYLGTDLSKINNELQKLRLNVAEGSTITPAIVEAQIGISKDYNVFELQRALGKRDSAKSFRIAYYFAADPRKHPMPVILGSLYNYFSKIYQLKELQARQASESEILKALKLRSAFFLKEYRASAKNYNRLQIETILGQLRIYDLKSKGIDYNSSGKPDGALLRELVWKVLHVQELVDLSS